MGSSKYGIASANPMFNADAIDTASSNIPMFTPSVRSILFARIIEAIPPSAPVPKEKIIVATAGETYADGGIVISL